MLKRSWINKKTLLASGVLVGAIVLAVLFSSTIFKTVEVDSTPENGLNLFPTPVAKISSAPKVCHSKTIAAAPKDIEEKLEKIAKDHNVTLEAAWLDPEKGVVRIGSEDNLPAWSTIKVPIALTATRMGKGEELTQPISTAIRVSDNDTATAIFEALAPSHFERLQLVDETLQSCGDETTKLNGEAFGMTLWDVADQVQFLSKMPCVDSSDQVIEDMSNITEGQRWGIGKAPNPSFKGGWGDANGVHSVRQMGWFTKENGERVILAIATISPDQASGQDAITEMVKEFNA